MTQINRRQFLAGATFWGANPGGLRAASKARGRMRITDIELHEILAPYHDYNAKTIFRYHGYSMQSRTIFILKTDIGLEGYGEADGMGRNKQQFANYIDTDPFDWIGDRQNVWIDMAIYDLIGKYLSLPAWKLIGPQVRSWVPMCGWTVSQAPEAMAEEVRSLFHRGYRWMKYHIDELQNVIDQTVAMQQAAPLGFKIHYDFNANANFEAVYPVLKELEKFPIAGRVEDPLRGIDYDGYRLLHQKCQLPVLAHHADPDLFMPGHLCDGFMAGHAPVGEAMRIAALAESTNIPFMLQNTGGTINQAFLAHEASVFRMATIEHVDGCNLWKDDVTVEAMPVVGGSVEVPNKPGLGVTIDREKLERYEKAPRPRQGRFLVRVRYASGPFLYFRFDPDASGANLRFLNPPGRGVQDSGYGPNAPGPLPGYGNPVVSDFWDEGSEEFEKVWKRSESGPVWTEASGK